MFEIHEIKDLAVGESITRQDKGFEVTLTRNFFEGSRAKPKLNLVITPLSSRSDDEWNMGADVDNVNERVSGRLRMHLSA